MLKILFTHLTETWGAFNVLTYITVRMGCALWTALALSVLLGPYVIRWLRKMNIGQHVRKEDVPDLHELHGKKAGTPTMGGILIIGSTALSTLLWADLSNRLVWVALIGFIYLGGVGFVDDLIKLRHKRSLGLTAWWKFTAQTCLGVAIGAYLYARPVVGEFGTDVGILFLKDVYLPLGLLYIAFSALVIVGSSNAVNLTDGLDGLAIGSIIMAVLAYTVVAYLVSRIDFAEYLYVPYVPEVSELTVFCGALVGTGLGFLWFNAHPAHVFMGDTGSLALGGALGICALLTKQELLLVIVGGLFVIEAMSVILQVGSFKLTGKRIFRMAPLHHHFELKGWSETQVTVRFWIIAAVFALMSLGALKMR